MDIDETTRRKVRELIGQWRVGADPKTWATNAVTYWRALLDGRPVDEMTAAVLAWSMMHDPMQDMMIVSLLHPAMGVEMMADLACDGHDRYGMNERVGRELFDDPSTRTSRDELTRARGGMALVGAVVPHGSDMMSNYAWRPLGLSVFAAWLLADPNAGGDARIALAAAPDMPDGSGSMNFLARLTLLCLEAGITPAWRRVPDVTPTSPSMSTATTPVEPVSFIRPVSYQVPNL